MGLDKGRQVLMFVVARGTGLFKILTKYYELNCYLTPLYGNDMAYTSIRLYARNCAVVPYV